MPPPGLVRAGCFPAQMLGDMKEWLRGTVELVSWDKAPFEGPCYIKIIWQPDVVLSSLILGTSLRCRNCVKFVFALLLWNGVLQDSALPDESGHLQDSARNGCWSVAWLVWNHPRPCTAFRNDTFRQVVLARDWEHLETKAKGRRLQRCLQAITVINLMKYFVLMCIYIVQL